MIVIMEMWRSEKINEEVMNNNKRPVLTELESIFLSILLPLPDHLTELSVVQLVVSAGIELWEGELHLQHIQQSELASSGASHFGYLVFA